MQDPPNESSTEKSPKLGQKNHTEVHARLKVCAFTLYRQLQFSGCLNFQVHG